MSEYQDYKEQPRNESRLNGVQKAELVVAAALAALSLNPKEVKAAAPHQEPTPLVEPLRRQYYGPYQSKKEARAAEAFNYTAPPACHSTDIWETITPPPIVEEVDSKPFDESVLDISRWNELEMQAENVEIKEKDYTVEVTDESATVIQIPLLQNTFIHRKYNDYRPVKQFSVPQGSIYKIIEERTLVGEDGESVNVGLIENNYAQQSASLLVMSAKDSNGVQEEFVQENNNVEEEQLTDSINNTVSISLRNDMSKYKVNGELSEVFDELYNPENLSVIEDLIEDDETVQSIIRLSELFKEYDLKTYDLPKYLRTTPWYQEMVEKNGIEVVEKALTIPYNVRIYSQPLQCVGFVQMMSQLYPELNILDITGGSTNEGAQSLIPSRLYLFWNADKPGEVPYLKDGIGIGGPPLDISEYERGDLFVMTGATYGHIGLVLGKYNVNGEVLLLIADSNKKEDGMVRLYIVNRYNIDNLLADHRFILRKDSNK